MGNVGYKKSINIFLCFVVPFLVCMIISCFPTFKMEISTSGTNFDFHALRIKGLWWSIENGIFPHHINDMANNFMGDADPIGYPYLFLYIPAYLLKFLPYTYCYNIYIIFVNIMTFILMYMSSYYIFKDKKVAIISSISFTLFYYRLYDIYDFCRMGEYTGLMFYPLAISGLYNIFFDDKKKWWFLTIAMCGALGSHIITFFYLLLMVMALFIIFFTTSLIIKREPLRIIEFIKAGIISVLLMLWYMVPFLEYYFEKSLNFSDMGQGAVSQNTIDFLMPWGYFNIVDELNTNIDSKFNIFIPTNMSFGDYISIVINIVLIVAIILVILYRYNATKDIKKVIKENFDDNIWYLILSIMFFIIYIYYYKASKAAWWWQLNGFDFIKEIYGKQQFSFRELGRGGVFLSLSIGYIFKKAGDIMFDIKPNIKLFKNISIYLVLIIMTLSTITYIKIKLEGRYRQDNISNSSLSDYQFKGTDAIIEDPDGNLVYEINNIIVTEIDGESTQYNTKMYHIDNYKRGYLSINFDYNCLSTVSHEKSEVLLLPKNAYTGYSFYIDGKKEDFVRAENGRPFIAIKGDKGHVNFKFENNIRWTIAFIISIITLFICIIKRLYKEIKSIKIFIKNSRGKKYE